MAIIKKVEVERTNKELQKTQHQQYLSLSVPMSSIIAVTVNPGSNSSKDKGFI